MFQFGIGLSSSTTRSLGSRWVFYQDVKYIDFAQCELCTEILKQYIMGSNPYNQHLSHCSQKGFSPIQLKDRFLFFEMLTLGIYHFGSSTCAGRVHCANQTEFQVGSLAVGQWSSSAKWSPDPVDWVPHSALLRHILNSFPLPCLTPPTYQGSTSICLHKQI